MADGNGIFGIHGAALALRSQRLEMLASNIANAATPNYKARDIDFGKALELATNGRTAKDAVEAAIAHPVPVTPPPHETGIASRRVRVCPYSWVPVGPVYMKK